MFIVFSLVFLATVVATVTSGGPPFDFTVTGNNSYRPLTLTEKVLTDEWAKKITTNNNISKEPIITNQQQGLYLSKWQRFNSIISSIKIIFSHI